MTAEIVVVQGRGRGGGGIHGERGGGCDQNGKKTDDCGRARIIDGELLLLLT